MKNLLLKTALLAALTAVAACSGGGGSGGADTDPRPPVVQAPGANASAAQLAAFAKQEDGIRASNGLVSHSKTVGDVTVTAQVIPGYGTGLVTRMEQGKKTVFAFDGDPVVSAATPDGVYTGQLNANYKVDRASQWQSSGGDMSIVLDTKNGQAHVDSMIGNGQSNMEYMGTAQVSGGRLTMNDGVVNVRDGEGFLISQEVGTLNGIVATGSETTAILGTVGSKNATSGFEMNGGFTTVYDPKYN